MGAGGCGAPGLIGGQVRVPLLSKVGMQSWGAAVNVTAFSSNLISLACPPPPVFCDAAVGELLLNSLEGA